MVKGRWPDDVDVEGGGRQLRDLTLWGRLTPTSVRAGVFWPGVAWLLLGSVWTVAALTGSPFFPWAATFSSLFMLGIVPLVILQLADMLEEVGRAFAPVIGTSDAEARAWLRERSERVFDVRRRSNLAIMATFLVGANAWYLAMGPPFQTMLANAFSFAIAQAVFLSAGHGTHVMFRSLGLAYALVRQAIRFPELDFGYRPVSDFSRYSYLLAVVTLTGYAWLAASIGMDAWPGSPFLTAALATFALYPLSSFGWSVLQIHHLQRRIKLVHLETVTREVSAAFAAFRNKEDDTAPDRVVRLLEVRAEIHRASEWPASFQTLATFALTGATAVSPWLAPFLR